MSLIVSVAPALPPYRYPQEEITNRFAELVLPAGTDRRMLDRLHSAAGVQTRHLALPIESYPAIDGFGAANDVFIEVAVELGQQAVSTALSAVGLTGVDVDLQWRDGALGLTEVGGFWVRRSGDRPHTPAGGRCPLV